MLKIILFTLTLIVSFYSFSQEHEVKVYCMSYEGLVQAKAAIEKEDPGIEKSYRKLLDQAEKALLAGPFSVTLNSKLPPSGDKHDYFSIPPYRGTGDGITNPEWYVEYDRVPLEKLTQTVETLSLAWYFTDDQKYAERAVELIQTWFIKNKTKMNPDLEFAQQSTSVGIIDTRFLLRIIDCIGILQSSGKWSGKNQEKMEDWCRQFADNVIKRIDNSHKSRVNNISSFYHAQMASLHLFTEDYEQAEIMIERTKVRLDSGLNSQGGFKEEWLRTRSLSYSSFHCFALFNLASMGKLVDIDLWNYTTEDGRGFFQALDYMAQNTTILTDNEWPHKEIEGAKGDWWKPFDDMMPVVFYHASNEYDNKEFRIVAEQILGAEIEEYKILLLCGLPLRWLETITY